MQWWKISGILCMFGCFKDFRPSESFITDYLTGPWKNFTSEEVNQDIYPVSTYSYTAMLIVIFLITDFVRYKPIIVICGLSGTISFVMIVFGKSIMVMQILEFFYGLFLSAEVAYYTYIYAKVEKKHYQEVTGHTKAASLIGRSLSGVVAQLSASFNLLDYHQLNYFTISSFALATIWSFFLPSVGQSVYFHRIDVSPDSENSENVQQEKQKFRQSRCYDSPWLCRRRSKSSRDENSTTHSPIHKMMKAYALLWKHFVHAYTNYHVLKWSIWWALSSCGFLQVLSYGQLLWQTAVQPGDKIYNGAVDFLYATIGAVTVFCVGKLRLNWDIFGDMILSACTFLEGIILVASSYSYNIWLIYAGFIIFGIIYHTMVTVASFEVAKYVSEDSYGLIFGLNIFFALVAQSLLTLVVVNALMLSIRLQFLVYGVYFVVLAAVYLVFGVIGIVQHRRSGKDFHLWVVAEDDDKTLSSTTQIS